MTFLGWMIKETYSELKKKTGQRDERRHCTDEPPQGGREPRRRTYRYLGLLSAKKI